MRAVEEKSFNTHDGVALFYRYWPAVSQPPQGAIVLFHRGHEHSGRMGHLADELDFPGFAVFAWDARGHGRSVAALASEESGQRGDSRVRAHSASEDARERAYETRPEPGSSARASAGEASGQRGFSPSIGASVRDVQTFIDHIVATYGIAVEQIAVVAQSVGAVLVSIWAHDYAPKIRCMVLASPAFKVKLYVPFARSGLKLQHKLRGDFFVNSYVKPQFLTHDPERVASYRADPLITRPIAVNILLGLYEASERVVADARAITVPTQLFISGADWVVHHGPQHRFFERWERRSRNVTSCRGSITTRSASSAARRPLPAPASSSWTVSRSRPTGRRCSTPIA